MALQLVPRLAAHKAEVLNVLSRMLAVLGLVAVAAACSSGGSAYQIWVVNERTEPVVITVEFPGQDPNVPSAQPGLEYTIPAGSEGCTYCGVPPAHGSLVVVYTAEGCVQLGAATLIGSNSYVITVPATGLVQLDHGGRPTDRVRGREIEESATKCG